MTCTLYLGDCLEYMKTMPDKSVDAVITDPPYGINLENHGAFVGDFNVIGDSDSTLANEIITWVENRNITIAVFCSPDLPYSGKWNNRLVWHKAGRGLGGDWERCWLRDWEMILVNAVRPINKKESAILNFHPADCTYHKCEKPVSLMKYLIEQLTNPGETIFDPFMGSGTTGVACVQLGRNFIGCEIDPKYYAIAEKRIKDAAAQPQLFTTEKQPQPEQEGLI
jgi:DNA modification methylase